MLVLAAIHADLRAFICCRVLDLVKVNVAQVGQASSKETARVPKVDHGLEKTARSFLGDGSLGLRRRTVVAVALGHVFEFLVGCVVWGLDNKKVPERVEI